MDKPYTLKYTRRNLPHWLVADHSYFVTLRLKGTLPKRVIEEFRAQRKALQESDADEARVVELARKQFASVERILDSVSDVQWPANPEVASVVWESLDWIRSREKFESTVRYIVNNPVKAGLVSVWSDWTWCAVDDSVRFCLADGAASA